MSRCRPAALTVLSTVAVLALVQVVDLAGIVAPGPTASAPGAAPSRAGASTADLSAGSVVGERAVDVPATALVEEVVAEVTARPLRPPRDQILADTLPGPAVLRERPDQLAEIGSRNRLGAREARRVLADPTTRVDPRGLIFYVDTVASGHDHAGEHEGHSHADGAHPEDSAVEELGSAEATTGVTLGATPSLARRYPTSETFRLHSRPGAARTIFIDADGATVSGTAWNAGTKAIPAGTWAGYSADSDPGAFTEAEHAWVQEVWRQVAEAYAPFDVNVTTQDRGRDAIVRSSGSDQTYGSHVVLTGSSTPAQAICGGSCLGVAYMGTFGLVDGGRHQPAWVFLSSRTSPTIAAQAVSHEVGHNLKLNHDAVPGQSYYSGSDAWGPIMGSARSRAVSQWSRGEYANASNKEDDLGVIAGFLPLRADDHGDTVATATRPVASAAYDVEGVISTRNDVDVIRLEVGCATTLAVAASGMGTQTTLDLSLDLLDAGGASIARHAPLSGRSSGRSTGMDAAITRAVGPGTYYARVDGDASQSGSIAQGTGWSDYASLGQFRLTATTDCLPTPASPSTAPSPTAPSASVGTPSADPTPAGTPSPTAPTAPPPTTPSTTPPTTPPSPAPPPPSSSPTPPSPVTRPAAPAGITASPGRAGRPITATVRWRQSADDGGSSVTSYRVTAYQLAPGNRVRRSFSTSSLRSTVRSAELRLPRGRYAFTVQAVNAAGASPWSARSAVVRAR